MNRVEAIEGFEVTIATLLDLPLQSTATNLQLQSMPNGALPELYAALIVFAVKARTYFEARGTYLVYSVRDYTES